MTAPENPSLRLHCIAESQWRKIIAYENDSKQFFFEKKPKNFCLLASNRPFC
jgi:hypothetical protein